MYQVILTNRGIERITQKLGLNELMEFNFISVGDGGQDDGADITPTPEMTALVRERWREPIINKYLHPNNSGQVMFEAHIPSYADDMDPNYVITEIGIWDNGEDNGGVPELMAVGNHPKTTKTSATEGHANDIRLVVPVLVGAAAQELVDLSIDPSVVYASKEEVERVTPFSGIAPINSIINLPDHMHDKDYVVTITPLKDERPSMPSNLSYYIERHSTFFKVWAADFSDFLFCYSVLPIYPFRDFQAVSFYSAPSFVRGATSISVSKDFLYNAMWATDVEPGEYPWEQSHAVQFQVASFVDIGGGAGVPITDQFTIEPSISPNGILQFQASAAGNYYALVLLSAGDNPVREAETNARIDITITE